MRLSAIVLDNILIIRFIYGLTFFSLGLMVVVQLRVPSRYRLASHLSALAAFALVHAFADWGLVFIPLQVQIPDSPALVYLLAARAVLMALSFVFLLRFGLGLMDRSPARNAAWVAQVPLAVGLLWLAGLILYPLYVEFPDVPNWLAAAEVWARYLIGLPGAVFTAIGLWDQTAEFRREQLSGHIGALRATAAGFGLYALTSGLIVPRQDFFPASVLNDEVFLALLDVPPELVRTLAILLVSLSTFRLLDVFRVESARRWRQAEEAQVVLAERQRIARELHDGLMQTLYGAGLGLKQARAKLPDHPAEAASVVAALEQALSEAIANLRRYVHDLRDEGMTGAQLRQALAELVGRTSRVSEIDIAFACEGLGDNGDGHHLPGRLPPGTGDHVLAIVGEALSNVMRHAAADKAEVLVAWQDDALVIRVTDDGQGFEPERAKEVGGHGLMNMASRVEQLGGVLRLATAPGRGTALTVHLPARTTQQQGEPS